MRLDELEERAIRQAASSAGLSVSDFMRRQLATSPVSPAPAPAQRTVAASPVCASYEPLDFIGPDPLRGGLGSARR